ncbi:zinc finger protein 569 isoform X1 [Manduca sexta]|uniref:zinc finger protein 569 isoform X1 n=1 Tax=Manduca sexta TaxID=7130 RepID=UPI0011837214|nr:zinc finger protein 569 isoform X1 [Manduca sexta]
MATEQIFLMNSDNSHPSPTTQKPFEMSEEPIQMDIESIHDFSNVCRTCAAVSEFVIPIFEGEGLQNNLADKISKHLPIQVSETDMLPRVVCYQCASTLLAWHELVSCCVQADAALRTRMPVPYADQATTTKQENCQNSNKIPEEKSDITIEFYNNVRNVLTDYFHTLNTDENDSNMKYVCQKCNVIPSLTTIAMLADHLQTGHSQEVSTKNDLETFIKEYITFEETLISEASDREMESDQEEKPDAKIPNYFCPFCENIYTSTTRLLCHLNKHVDVTLEKGVVCCEVLYKDKKHFIDHLQKDHVDRSVKSNVCKTCGYVTDDNNDLQKHISEAHPPNERQKKKKLQSAKNQKYIPAVCPECNKTFSNKYNMFVHLKSHSSGGPEYPCDKCDRSYKNQGNLRSHQRLAHEGVLNHVCSECGEAFPTRAGRDTHARIHSGAKPYKCNYCGKAYRAKNTLDRHIEIHFDVRKYECDICSKKFRKRTHLNYHLRTHAK